MSREGAEVTSAGSAFQTRAPATEKARRPTVGSLTAGTHRSSEVEDRRTTRPNITKYSVHVDYGRGSALLGDVAICRALSILWVFSYNGLYGGVTLP